MGMPCYIIGITKEIRNKIGKNPGDEIKVTIERMKRKEVWNYQSILKF